MKSIHTPNHGAAGQQPTDAGDRRDFLKAAGVAMAASTGMLSTGGSAMAATTTTTGATGLPSGADNFYTSSNVTVRPVRFKNQYQMTVAGNLFVPKALDRQKTHSAIVVGHPMGAVKEQSANLYVGSPGTELEFAL